MCIRRETREKVRRSLAFSPVSKPHTHITYMLRQCTSIVYIYDNFGVMPKIKYMMLNVQDYSFLYNNAVRSIIFEGLAFYSHVESTCMTASLTNGGGFDSRHCLLKYLYQARKVSCHLFVCSGYRFCLFLRF